jgi:hypothetical protein
MERSDLNEMKILAKKIKSKVGSSIAATVEALKWNVYRLKCPLTRSALTLMPAEHLDYIMNISPRYKYIYVDNPKTGCSSLKSALVEFELQGAQTDLDCYDWKVFHDPIASPLKRVTRLNTWKPLSFLVADGYQFITFVRNPYTRLLSCYRDKILKNRPQKLQVLRLLKHPTKDIERMISFDEFVKAVVKQSDSEMNPHWRVQTTQILYRIFNYSFIGRFESYENDFVRLFESISNSGAAIPAQRHLNRTREGKREGCRDYYTKELQDLVYERYKEDFSNFGYKYKLPE